jgi:phenylacetate-coenzyme A ligase PaaK-like adenylate-forming protein
LARLIDEGCPCGRHTRLLADLVGRRNDGFLLRDGRRLPAGFLLDVSYRAILGDPDLVTSYRFVQRDPDTAVFEVVPGTSWHEGSAAEVVASLTAELPASLSVSVAEVAEIPRSAGGKRQTVVRAF